MKRPVGWILYLNSKEKETFKNFILYYFKGKYTYSNGIVEYLS